MARIMPCYSHRATLVTAGGLLLACALACATPSGAAAQEAQAFSSEAEGAQGAQGPSDADAVPTSESADEDAEPAAGADGMPASDAAFAGLAAPAEPACQGVGDYPLSDENAAADISASLSDFLTPAELSSLGVSALSAEDGTTTFAELMAFATQYLGMGYVWGSSDPANGGFDCSGFIAWVYDSLTGTHLRSTGGTAEGIYYADCTPVSRDEARPGDLVFFCGTYQSEGQSTAEALASITHVGIYLGDGKMLHAGSNGISYAQVDWIYSVAGSRAPQLYGRLRDASVLRQTYYRFYDTPADAWYVTGGYLDYVVDSGYMTGTTQPDGSPTGCFLPEDVLTRAQVATILYRFANPFSTDTTEPDDYGSVTHFGDVGAGCYYTAAVEWCYQMGVVTGYTDENGEPTGAFGPYDPVTRGELATMVARFATRYGERISNGDFERLDAMPDAADVPAFAYEPLAWCLAHGVITGYIDGEGEAWLLPENGATRAQMTKVMTVLVRDVIGA